jgi:two-component system OmpR family sensor kinase
VAGPTSSSSTSHTCDAITDARTAGPDHLWRLDLPEEPVTVTGDEANLHQAVANLLANARVHTSLGNAM